MGLLSWFRRKKPDKFKEFYDYSQNNRWKEGDRFSIREGRGVVLAAEYPDPRRIRCRLDDGTIFDCDQVIMNLTAVKLVKLKES